MGCGVGFYIRESLSFVVRKDISNLLLDVCECVAIEVKVTHRKNLYVSVYRPPETDIRTFTASF